MLSPIDEARTIQSLTVTVLLSLLSAWIFAALLPFHTRWEWISSPKKQKSAVNRKNDYPAGPTPFPILGNILSFWRLMKETEEALINLSVKYGETCMLWLGRSPVLLINSPIAAKELLDKVRTAFYSFNLSLG
jgi:hypothetical protein